MPAQTSRTAGPATAPRLTIAPPQRPPGVRERSAQATRASILKAAIKVFSTHGFGGGRVEQISRAARSHDRKIYYYFGSKEGLFIAALEEIYRRFNEAEAELKLDPAWPIASLTTIVRFMWTYYLKHPEFIRLLNSENLLGGRHLSKSSTAREYSFPAIAIVETVLAAGRQQGVVRPDLSARDVYLTIASLGYFYLSNRHTLSSFLGEPLDQPDQLVRWEAHIVDVVLRAVSPDGSPARDRVDISR